MESRPYRVLDFDTENVPGFYWFGNPAVSTDLLHTIAWSWMEEERVLVGTQEWSPDKGLNFPECCFDDFVRAVESADIVTGHNILRHDVPLLNATAVRMGKPPIKWPGTFDTLQVLRNMKLKGFPKGQEYLADFYDVGERKMHVGLHVWEKAARGEPEASKVVVERCVSDVVSHKELYGRIRNG